jgi:hypothetical protein
MTSVLPSRSGQPAADHIGFFKAVQRAYALHLKAQAISADLAPRLVEDYPRDRNGQKFDTSFDVVLFRVAGSQPATLAKGIQPTGMIAFGSEPSRSKAGYHDYTRGWIEEATVEFSVYAKSNARANEVAVWFHRFMMFYGFSEQFFKAQGVPFFGFKARLPDEKVTEFGQDLYKRTLQYVIRLQFLEVAEAKDLETLHVISGEGTPVSPAAEFDITADG